MTWYRLSLVSWKRFDLASSNLNLDNISTRQCKTLPFHKGARREHDDVRVPELRSTVRKHHLFFYLIQSSQVLDGADHRQSLSRTKFMIDDATRRRVELQFVSNELALMRSVLRGDLFHGSHDLEPFVGTLVCAIDLIFLEGHIEMKMGLI